MAPELVPKLAVIVRHLLKASNFPACWRFSYVVLAPNESSSSDVRDYRPISITTLLSNVFRRLCLGSWVTFWKVTVCFLLISFCIRGPWNVWCLAHIVSPSASCSGQGMEGNLVQLYFSAAFDRVTYRGLLHTLRSIWGQFLSIVLEFFSDRRQNVRLDGKVTELVNVVSRVLQGSALGPLLSTLYTSELHCWESYCVLCWWCYDFCSYS